MAKESFVSKLKDSSQIFGTVGSVFGFISDVIQPIQPFIHVATTILGGATGVLFFCFIFRSRHPYLERAAEYFTQGLVLTVVLSFFWILGLNTEKGFFADNFEAIAKLQEFLVPPAEAYSEESVTNITNNTFVNSATEGNGMRMNIATHELRDNPSGLQDHLVNAHVLFNVGDYRSAESIFDSVLNKEFFRYDLFERYYEVLFHNYKGNVDSVNLKLTSIGVESNPMMRIAELNFLYEGVDYYRQLSQLNITDPLLLALAENMKARSLQADLNHYYLYENYVMDYWIPRMRRNEQLLGKNLVNLSNRLFDYPKTYRAYRESTTHPYHGHTIWDWHSYDPGNQVLASRMWNRLVSGAAKAAIMSPPITITGTVTDESGEPLFDVVITDFDTAQPSGSQERINMTATDEKGRFTLRTGKGHLLRFEDSYGSHELREKFEIVQGPGQLDVVLKGREENK